MNHLSLQNISKHRIFPFSVLKFLLAMTFFKVVVIMEDPSQRSEPEYNRHQILGYLDLYQFNLYGDCVFPCLFLLNHGNSRQFILFKT